MANNIYNFEVKGLDGKTIRLSDYKGKVLMLVNIASRCGQTPQLDAMQKLYEKYRDKGFEVLAFPSNEFGGQQPEDGMAIQEFCSKNYGTTFKIFAKNKVKGSEAQPLYHYLANETRTFFGKNYPVWNFQKYIIDRNGKVTDWFYYRRWADSDKITEAIEKCLNKASVEK